jgi:tetratricopeptide (TPR) repeat protein
LPNALTRRARKIPVKAQKIAIDAACRENRLDEAKRLAQAWTRNDPLSPAAWSKLARVHELERDYDGAAVAIGRAVELSPEHPPYLFEAGVVDFFRGQFESAETAFNQCVSASVELASGFYLDAAKVARAKCLIACARIDEALGAIEDVADAAAAWLNGRVTAGELRQQVGERGETPSA